MIPREPTGLGIRVSRNRPGPRQVGALLVAVGRGIAAEHALVSLLALNGLRVSEATGADIETLGKGRGHRTLTITRKGGKEAAILLAPRTARAIDLAIGERCDRPMFLTASGEANLCGLGVDAAVRRSAAIRPVGLSRAGLQRARHCVRLTDGGSLPLGGPGYPPGRGLCNCRRRTRCAAAARKPLPVIWAPDTDLMP
jgi:integrase